MTAVPVGPSLVVGASGFLGRHLLGRLGPGSTGTFHRSPFPGGVRFDAADMRLRDVVPDLGRRFTHAFVPYGTIDMEGCARDPETTSKINVDSVRRVLDELLSAGVRTVFVSTDYIFDGTRSFWTEEDVAEPRMAYGHQKLAVERWLADRPGPWLVVRLSKIVSGDTRTHSMLGQWVNDIKAGKTMRCADDQFFSPAWVEDLAGAMIALAGTEATGIHHLAGRERFSRIGLLQLLVEHVRAVDPGVTAEVVPAKLHDFPFLERRPLDTSLSTRKLQDKIAWPFKTMNELCASIAAAEFGR